MTSWRQIDGITRGETVVFSFAVKNQLTGIPIAITGGTVYLTVKDFAHLGQADSTALFQIIVASGDLTDPTNGQTYIEISSTQTDMLVANTTYYIDVKFISSTGKASYWLKAQFAATNGVTETIVVSGGGGPV